MISIHNTNMAFTALRPTFHKGIPVFKHFSNYTFKDALLKRSYIATSSSSIKKPLTSTKTIPTKSNADATSTPQKSTVSPKPTTTITPESESETSIGAVSSKLQLHEAVVVSNDHQNAVDWSQSYHGLGLKSFPAEAGKILTTPLESDDIEIKPDGLLYLPEIKYRRILNRAFGPGGWGLAPRGQTTVTPRMVTREYALIAEGRLVAVARGEQDYFDPNGIPTATEGCKSNAMMRCCKDLGVASELWDPRFIRVFKKKYCQQVMVEHVTTKRKKLIWIRKDDEVSYPYKK